MPYKFFQEDCVVLTTKGYTSLEVLTEGDILISLDPVTKQTSKHPVNGVSRCPVKTTFNRITTTDISIPTYLPKDTLICCTKDKAVSYIPVKILTHTVKPICLYRPPEALYSVVPFDGIIDIWDEVYRVPIRQVRKAYDEGTRLLGVSPLVLYTQLGSEKQSKFFRGLLRTTQDEREILSERLTRHKNVVCQGNRRAYEFRCIPDAFNFQSLFPQYSTSIRSQTPGNTRLVYTTINKTVPRIVDESGFSPVNMKHNHAKSAEGILVELETEAPTVIINTFVVKG